MYDKYCELDCIAAPDRYVAMATHEDLAYLSFFRDTCKRYNIDFANADCDEKDFVIRMAEKGFYKKHA